MAIDLVGYKEGNIQSFNRYAYANNNPYLYIDPDGNEPVDALIEQLRQNGGHMPSTSRLGNAANTLGNDIMPAAGDVLGDPVNLVPGGALGGGILKESKLLNNVIKLRGLNINRNLQKLTHQDIVKAFQGTGFNLSNHAIKRLKDSRTNKLGFNTPNDIAKIFNKGKQFDAGAGEIGYSYKGLEAIVNSNNNRIVTI